MQATLPVQPDTVIVLSFVSKDTDVNEKMLKVLEALKVPLVSASPYPPAPFAMPTGPGGGTQSMVISWSGGAGKAQTMTIEMNNARSMLSVRCRRRVLVEDRLRLLLSCRGTLIWAKGR